MTCFDAALGSLPARWLPDDRVVDLLGPSPHTVRKIERYRERMLAGDRFPPIAVVPVAGHLLLADGHKRLAAFRWLADVPEPPARPETIPVEVWTLRRWLADQGRQARTNLELQRRILTGLFVRPRESAQIASSIAGHWWRVARSLAGLTRRALAARR